MAYRATSSDTFAILLMLAPLLLALWIIFSGIALVSTAKDIILFIMGAMVSLGVGIGGQVVLSHRNRPILRIDGLAKDPAGVVQKFQTDLPSGQHRSAGVARLLVTNVGRTAAEDCRARLVVIDKRISGDTEVNPCWTEFGGAQILTVYPTETARLDLYGIPNPAATNPMVTVGTATQSEVLVASSRAWTSYVTITRPATPGLIQIRVQIFCKNADPSQPQVFEV